MNDKERLEEIKERFKNGLIRLGRQGGKTRFIKDVNYLFEQAERVEELEEDNESLQIFDSINRKRAMELHKQNKRYREALQKIATAKDCVDAMDYVEKAINISRQALESESE